MKKLTLIAAALGLSGAVPANAAVVSETINFSFSDFIDIGPSAETPSYGTVTGSFTVEIDPLVSHDVSSSDIVIHSLTAPSSDVPLGFRYDASRQWLYFGSAELSIPSNANGFIFVFDISDLDAPTAVTCAPTNPVVCGTHTGDPDVFFGGYADASMPAAFFHATSGTITGGVPEPATWAMMIAGLGLAGAAMRRRRVAVAFA